jgi:zinc and cadmium transporter
MWPSLLLALYCVLLLIASLVGGWLPGVVRLTHTRMQLMMSFVGGLMLGVAILHLLPHAVVQTGNLDHAAWSCILGLLAMFLIIRVFNVHQHGPVSEPDGEGHGLAMHDHDHQHAHHDCRHPAERDDARSHPFTWAGLFVGLGVHSLLDGIAVAASVAAAAGHGETGLLLGAGTFFAVLFHKPLDSLSITSVMAVGNWSPRARNLVNLIFALVCPIGAFAFFYGMRELGSGQQLVVGCALGFSAGAFLCISLADILPEIQFHYHDRVKLTAALLVGVALSFAIGLAESEHAHDHSVERESNATLQGDAEHDHDHDHDHGVK